MPTCHLMLVLSILELCISIPLNFPIHILHPTPTLYQVELSRARIVSSRRDQIRRLPAPCGPITPPRSIETQNAPQAPLVPRAPTC
ncbi:hypothetical protein DFH08DRAFT_841673 [Mycena albidolilacea]|uniref:Secreted protein n=1 Tax=Mycena albidolilacea TaxID=1033008 RepID=A0AAD7AMT5_9AGAR|nr:hypothetical protein DFH08DRAFT_841673 [Mycena albidolilacea]